MGTFHMAKVALGCLGKLLAGSGAETILVESGVFGANVVQSVITGKNYIRSLKGMQLLKEAMLRLEWAEFFKHENCLRNHKEELDILVQLKRKVANVAADSVNVFREFNEVSAPLFSEFDRFRRTARSTNETFKYWDTFIELMLQVDNLIRSDREGDWNLHLQTVQSLLPIFAAFDSTNYLRWCSLYLEDMRKLPSTAPEIHQAFQEGKFVVKRTPGHFNSVGADMALEQTINRSQKSSSGIIGSTRKKTFVAMWELIYHEMLAISNLHRELSGIKTGAYRLAAEHALSKSDIATGEQQVQAILTVIEQNENPFQLVPVDVKLHNILTQETMTEEIRSQILNVTEIGKTAYHQLRAERFVEKSVRFSSPIHRTNLKTFSSLHKTTKEIEEKSSKKRKERNEMTRAIDVARAEEGPWKNYCSMMCPQPRTCLTRKD